MIEEAARGNGHTAQVIARTSRDSPFVRETLRELEVLATSDPWEKDDGPNGGTLRDPSKYAEMSVATWSTHDTRRSRLVGRVTPVEKEQIEKLSGAPRGASDEPRLVALLSMLFKSRASLTLTLVQELLGERARINTPATVATRTGRTASRSRSRSSSATSGSTHG